MQPYPPQQGYPQQPPQQYGPPPQYAPQQPPPPAYAPQGQAPAYQPQQPPQQYGPPPQTPPTAAPAVGPGQWAKPEQSDQGDRVKASDLDNHLVIVVPVSFHPAFFAGKPATYDAQGAVKEAEKAPSNAVKVNVVDLDAVGPDGRPGLTYLGVMWGGKVLAEGLNRQLGAAVLARMGKGQARGSNAAPMLLNDASADPNACQRADEFVNRRPNWQNEPNTPAGPPPQSPAVAYGQPAQGYGLQPPQQGYPAPGGMPPQYGQPQQYGPPQGYPQQAQPAYAPNAYQPGTAGPTSPEAQAAYGNVAAQQYPQQYQQ